MKKTVFTLTVLIFISCNLKTGRTEQIQKLHKNVDIKEVVPERFIKKLPDKLRENSGIIYYDNLIWTFNDSGGKNTLYAFNSDGEIKREVEIEDAKNNDWEDITQDDKYIYIGDFGNNDGIRTNQKIYRVKKKDIKNKKEQKVKSSTIKFDFKNQDSFLFLPKRTPFDCEATVEFEGSLYIFTKDWSDRTTTVYRIPAKKGEYEITPIEKFNVAGLITAADVSPDKKKLVLLGYANYQPFIWLFTDIEPGKFFTGKKTHINLDKIFDAQTEGICFYGNNYVLISCERSSTFLQQVFRVDLRNID